MKEKIWKEIQSNNKFANITTISKTQAQKILLKPNTHKHGISSENLSSIVYFSKISSLHFTKIYDKISQEKDKLK
jgi:hypothetical protein